MAKTFPELMGIGGKKYDRGPQAPTAPGDPNFWALDPAMASAYGDNPLAKQVMDYANKQLGAYQGGYNTAVKNNNVGSWGGSAQDAQAWAAVARNNLSNAKTINSNLYDLLEHIKNGTIDSSNPGNIQLAKDFLGGDLIAKEKLNELASGQKQLKEQNQKLQDFRDQLETQQFGGKGMSLTDALNSTGGDIGNLNKFLGGQEARTFNEQLKPLIQMALGSNGLENSGANVELQSKALGQLQQSREQSMMQAALGARGQIQGLQRQDVLGDVAAKQTMMNNQFDLGRAGITMQYQQQLEQHRMDLARELAGRNGGAGGAGIGSLIGAGVGALGFIGGPGTGLAGMGLGASLGGTLGGMASPGTQNNAGQGLGSSFFAASSMMPKATSKNTNQSQNSAFGTYNS